MPTIPIDEFDVFYEDQGTGPALVFLHGLGSSSRDWAFQVQHFAKSFRCLTFDLPGSGASRDREHPKGPYSVAGFARAVAGALRHLGLPPAHVVGLSMGGMTALQLALDAPDVVRTLTVTNATASVQPSTLRDRFLLGLRAVLTKTLGPKAVGKLVAPRLFPKPDQEALRAQFVAQMAALEPVTYAAVSAAVMGWSVEQRVDQLRCPTLLLASDADYTPVAQKQALAAKIPGSKVVVVPDSHHALPIEKPAEFNAALERFLAAHSG